MYPIISILNRPSKGDSGRELETVEIAGETWVLEDDQTEIGIQNWVIFNYKKVLTGHQQKQVLIFIFRWMEKKL